MDTTNTTVLQVLRVLFWVTFIGLCIKTGALLISVGVSLFVNDQGAGNLYEGLKLSKLWAYSRWSYVQIISFLIALTALKAYIAYLIVRIFQRFSFSKPFHADVAVLLRQISVIALETGIVALLASIHSKWLVNRGNEIPINWGAEELLFFAGVMYLLAHVFRKGAELQTESELTV